MTNMDNIFSIDKDKFEPIDANRLKENNKIKVLLIGNGLSRAFGCTSWPKLIEELAKKNKKNEFSQGEIDRIKGMPGTLGAVVACGGNEEVLNKQFEIKDFVFENEQDLVKSITKPYTMICTTNYTTELEHSLWLKSKKAYTNLRYTIDIQDYDEQLIKNLFRYNRPGTGSPNIKIKYDKYIWHIHGQCGRSDNVDIKNLYSSLALGTESYLKMARYLLEYSDYYNQLEDKENYIFSWIDLFLRDDVQIDIIGYGIDFVEVHIWWLLEQASKKGTRIRLFDVFDGRDEGWKLLCKSYGIEMYDYSNVKNELMENNENSDDAFKKIYEAIGKDINIDKEKQFIGVRIN